MSFKTFIKRRMGIVESTLVRETKLCLICGEQMFVSVGQIVNVHKACRKEWARLKRKKVIKLPNNAGETTQVEYDTNAANSKGTLNDAGQETQVTEETDNASEESVQNQPKT